MNNKLRIAIIGCTKSTENLINKLIKNKDINLLGLITLDESLAYKKARFVNLESKNFNDDFEVKKVKNLHDDSLIEKIYSWNLDLLIEIGWSQKIPVSILNIPKAGTIGIHNSLLPAYQGGASLNWALIKDYSSWGCTLFHLEENIDAGEIIFQESFNITDHDDINTLFLKSDKLSIEMINRYLPLALKNSAPRIKQNPSEISKTPRRKPEDGAICWQANNRTIFNLVRALKRPYPPAFSFLHGKKVLVNGASLEIKKTARAGMITEITDSGIVVSTGSGSILLTEIEYEDGSSFVPKIGESFNE
jgi:methionyl-tRNA formyltransferase